MNLNKKRKHYISQLDKLLQAFDRTHEPSAIQRKEKEASRVIFALRDSVAKMIGARKKKLWDGF